MRYIPHTEEDINEMLEASGFKSVEDLFKSIPTEAKLGRELNLPKPLEEIDLLRHLKGVGKKNQTVCNNISFLGAGSYNHFTPAAVNDVASRSEWVTPYTPYQPEISQGTLQAIFEYQTMICNLTGMEVSNASHYDGATATAEAALMAISKTRKNKIVTASTLHPEYKETIKSLFKPKNHILAELPYSENGNIDIDALKSSLDDETAGVIVQTPNFFGIIEDLDKISKVVHENGSLLIVTIAEPVSLGMLKSPGFFGADVVTAEGQAFGGGLNYGGPYLGIFAAREKFLRAMPGRVVGETVDSDGKQGFVLTMSTREQHIRREKAASNICSNEALMALRATIYLSLLGKEGLKKLAEINFSNAQYLKSELSKLHGVEISFNSQTFNEFVIKVNKCTNELSQNLLKKNIFAGVPLECWYPELKNHLVICTTECHTKDDLDRFTQAMKAEMGGSR